MSERCADVVFGIANGTVASSSVRTRMQRTRRQSSATWAPHHGVAEGGRVGGAPAEHAAKMASVVARENKPVQVRRSATPGFAALTLGPAPAPRGIAVLASRSKELPA